MIDRETILDILVGRRRKPGEDGEELALFLIMKKKYRRQMAMARYGYCPFCGKHCFTGLDNHIRHMHPRELDDMVREVRGLVRKYLESVVGGNSNGFGKKGRSVKVVSFKIPEEVLRKIDLASQKTGLNRSELIRSALSLVVDFIMDGDV